MINLFNSIKKKYRRKKKKFFAFNRYLKHPSYVFDKNRNDEYLNLLITEAEYTDRKKNMKLSRNPDPLNPDKPAHIVREINKNEYRVFSFGNKSRKWKFDKKDKKKVNKLIKELKQKEKR